MKNEHSEHLIWDVDPISSLIQMIHYRHISKGLKSISILSENRAEGKTTVAMLIARGLREVYGLRVLFVDLNPEGDPLMNQYFDDYEFQDGFVKGHSFNFDIFRLKNLEMNWLKTAFDGLYTNQLINSLSNHYDIVIVDTMSTHKARQFPIVVNTHTNIIVATKDTFKENNLEKGLIEDKKDVLGVIFNK